VLLGPRGMRGLVGMAVAVVVIVDVVETCVELSLLLPSSRMEKGKKV
jgi:hypothetical protein